MGRKPKEKYDKCDFHEIASKLKKIRNSKKLTQENVDSALGWASGRCKNYETAYRDIPLEKLVQLADFYGCSIDYLLGCSSVPYIEGDVLLASKVTGLNEYALNGLNYCTTNYPQYTDTLNCLFQHSDDENGVMFLILDFLFSKPLKQTLVEYDPDSSTYRKITDSAELNMLESLLVQSKLNDIADSLKKYRKELSH